MIDKYKAYLLILPISVINPFSWWRDYQIIYPRLSQMVFDLLFILVISVECERVFVTAAKHSGLRTAIQKAIGARCAGLRAHTG
jgi:hypothetical protein